MKLIIALGKKNNKMINNIIPFCNYYCSFSLKYVKDKPVRDLSGDQFLKLCLAEEEQLLTITINDTIEGNSSNSYIEEVKQLYIRVMYIIHLLWTLDLIYIFSG